MTTSAVPQVATSVPEKRRSVSVKTIAAGIAAGVVAAAGVLGAGRARSEPNQPPQQAQPAISVPAATSADIADLRERFDRLSEKFDTKLDALNTRLSRMEGWVDGSAAREGKH